MSGVVGELIGTMILITLGCGVVAGVKLKNTNAHGSGWLLITIAWGIAVAISVFAVGQFSGGHLNPAVTIGLAFNGSFPWADVPGYILAQMLGAMIGAVLVYFHYLPHWSITDNPNDKLGIFATGPAIKHSFSNLLSEMLGTFILVLGVLAIGANTLADGLNPLIIGTLITVIGMSLGGTTGFAINPARDLGPRMIHALLPIPGKRDSNWTYAWIPIVGPILGGAFAGLFYKAVFIGTVVNTFWYIGGIIILMLTITYYTSRESDSLDRKTQSI